MDSWIPPLYLIHNLRDVGNATNRLQVISAHAMDFLWLTYDGDAPKILTRVETAKLGNLLDSVENKPHKRRRNGPKFNRVSVNASCL
jgi:hypothetical protein